MNRGMNGFYQPSYPYPYPDPTFVGVYGGQQSAWAQGVGALPPASTDSEQGQVSDQLSQRVVVIGVLATLAVAAVIYTSRKH
jgi:hypothetical protein